jgi:hypothetical protein
MSGAHRRPLLAFVSVATPISRAAGALTWLTNHLGNRTRAKNSPPRKRKRRRRPRKSRRRHQRSPNPSASKTEAVGNRIPTNPGGPLTEQPIVDRVKRTRESRVSEAGDAHCGRAHLVRSRTRLALGNSRCLATEYVAPLWGHRPMLTQTANNQFQGLQPDPYSRT